MNKAYQKNREYSGYNYQKTHEISEKKRHQATLNDPDAQPLTKEKLLKFKRVNPFITKNKTLYSILILTPGH